MICPKCKQPLTKNDIIALFSAWRGSHKKPPNPKSAENGKKGGRPKGSKNKLKSHLTDDEADATHDLSKR